jgi:hypothetical protein
MGEDIFYNNIGSFFFFSDFSKYIFQTKRNFQLSIDIKTIFAGYWDDIFLSRNFELILFQNIDDYFMKIFNFNKKKFLEIKMTNKLLDNLLREITVDVLLKKKISIIKHFGKIKFLEKKFIYIFKTLEKNSYNYCKKKAKIIKIQKKKKFYSNR